MRWLILILLVSLAGLLIAAAGLARHIWMHHRRGETEANSSAGAPSETAPETEDGHSSKN